MKKFREECKRKVKDKRVPFGDHELSEDVTGFLERMSTELEKTFNSTCTFTGLYQVLIKHMVEMAEAIMKMRGNVQQLCATPGQNAASKSSYTATEKASEDKGEEPNQGFIKEEMNIQQLCATPGQNTASETSYTAKEKASEDKSEVPVIPNLGFIKEKVNIPPVKLAWWKQIMETFRKAFLMAVVYMVDDGYHETSDFDGSDKSKPDSDDGTEPDVEPELHGSNPDDEPDLDGGDKFEPTAASPSQPSYKSVLLHIVILATV